MSDFAENITACHRCPKRQPRCAGACLCTVDDIDITIHAQAGLCPAGNYGPGKLAQLTHGTIGLAKAALGINPTPPEVMEQRAAICRTCEMVTLGEDGHPKKCRLCGCGLWRKKIAVATEACPAGKWGSCDPPREA